MSNSLSILRAFQYFRIEHIKHHSCLSTNKGTEEERRSAVLYNDETRTSRRWLPNSDQKVKIDSTLAQREQEETQQEEVHENPQVPKVNSGTDGLDSGNDGIKSGNDNPNAGNDEIIAENDGANAGSNKLGHSQVNGQASESEWEILQGHDRDPLQVGTKVPNPTTLEFRYHVTNELKTLKWPQKAGVDLNDPSTITRLNKWRAAKFLGLKFPKKLVKSKWSPEEIAYLEIVLCGLKRSLEDGKDGRKLPSVADIYTAFVQYFRMFAVSQTPMAICSLEKQSVATTRLRITSPGIQS